MTKKKSIVLLCLVMLGICSASLWAIDYDDIVDQFALVKNFSVSAVPATAMPAGLQQAIKDKKSWSGSALITVNKDGSPTIAFYDFKSIPTRNQVLYTTAAIDKTSMDNLKKRDEALQVTLIYDGGLLKPDGTRVILEYVDDKSDIKKFNTITGGNYTYFEVEHMYKGPAAILTTK